MNIVITLGVAALAVCVLWGVQSVGHTSSCRVFGMAAAIRDAEAADALDRPGHDPAGVDLHHLCWGRRLRLRSVHRFSRINSFQCPFHGARSRLPFRLCFFRSAFYSAFYIRAGWLQFVPSLFDQSNASGAKLASAVFDAACLWPRLRRQVFEERCWSRLASIVAAAILCIFDGGNDHPELDRLFAGALYKAAQTQAARAGDFRLLHRRLPVRVGLCHQWKKSLAADHLARDGDILH